MKRMSDKISQQESEFETKLKKAVSLKKEEELMSRWSKLMPREERTQQNRVKNNSMLKLFSGIAASLIIVTVAGFLFTKNHNSSKKIAQHYINQLDINVEPSIFLRGEESNRTEDLFEAYVAIDGNNYDEAAEVYEKQLGKTPLKLADKYYYSGVLLKLGKYEKAISLLSEVIDGNGKFYEESQWAISLALLQNEQRENALFWLKKIKDNGQYRSIEASEIIEKIQ